MWVAGDSVLSHWDGSTWSNVAPFPSDGNALIFAAVWAASPSDAWAIENNTGVIYRWNGMQWAKASIPVTQVNTVWGTASDDVWMVGPSSGVPGSDEAPIFHFDGVTWTKMSSGTKNSFYAISGSSKTRAWAVGDFGTILQWNGQKWAADQSNTTTALYAVWASGDNDVWAVGIGGVDHGDGSAWTFTKDPLLLPSSGGGPTGVFGRGPNDVYTVGDDSGGQGAIHHYDGSAWSTVLAGAPASIRLSVIWGALTGEMWVVGGDRRVLHHRP